MGSSKNCVPTSMIFIKFTKNNQIFHKKRNIIHKRTPTKKLLTKLKFIKQKKILVFCEKKTTENWTEKLKLDQGISEA
jgi:hypothetical protein